MGYAIFCGILFLIIAVSANSAHINLLENYYKKTADLEKSYFEKDNEKRSENVYNVTVIKTHEK